MLSFEKLWNSDWFVALQKIISILPQKFSNVDKLRNLWQSMDCSKTRNQSFITLDYAKVNSILYSKALDYFKVQNTTYRMLLTYFRT